MAALAPLSASAGVGGGAVRTDLASKDIQLPAYVPVRRFQDVFTVDGVNRKVFVEFGWDYRAGTTVETVYDEAGETISRTRSVARWRWRKASGVPKSRITPRVITATLPQSSSISARLCEVSKIVTFSCASF